MEHVQDGTIDRSFPLLPAMGLQVPKPEAWCQPWFSHPLVSTLDSSANPVTLLLKIFQILSLLSSSTATVSGESPFSASPFPPPIEFPHTLARVTVLTHKSDQPFSSLKPCGGFPLCWNETQTLYHAWAGSQLGLLPALLTSSRHTSFLSAPNGPAVSAL